MHDMIATRILRRARVLIVGCGDVGLRARAALQGARRRAPRDRAHEPSRTRRRTARGGHDADLSAISTTARSLGRLAGLAPTVLHLAPPQKDGDDDRRTRALIAALSARRRSVARGTASATAPHRAWRAWFRATVDRAAKARETAVHCTRRTFRRTARHRALVYASTTGVYGDCGGAWIDETRPVRPGNARAKRRVSAERAIAARGRARRLARVDRADSGHLRGQSPADRAHRKGHAGARRRRTTSTRTTFTPTISPPSSCARSRARKPQRVINASDDTDLRMGDYFDRVADAYGMPRVPRITRGRSGDAVSNRSRCRSCANRGA